MRSLGRGVKPCRNNFVSRLFRFVIDHFRRESRRTDIKSGRILEAPNNVGRQFPLPVTSDTVVEYLTDQR